MSCGIRVENEVAAAVLYEQTGPHVVMGVELLESVVAPGDPNAPGLVVQVVVLRHAGDVQALEVDPAAGPATDCAWAIDAQGAAFVPAALSLPCGAT